MRYILTNPRFLTLCVLFSYNIYYIYLCFTNTFFLLVKFCIHSLEIKFHKNNRGNVWRRYPFSIGQGISFSNCEVFIPYILDHELVTVSRSKKNLNCFELSIFEIEYLWNPYEQDQTFFCGIYMRSFFLFLSKSPRGLC